MSFIAGLTGASPASFAPTNGVAKPEPDGQLASRVKQMAADSIGRAQSSGIHDYYAAITHFAAATSATASPSADHAAANAGASSSKSVADMTLAEKVSTSASAGLTTAAKETGGALKTALSDPKTQAALVGTTAAVAGAQLVPGLDLAVDATLGTVGVAMYAASAPAHRDNITAAMGKLKNYVSEVGNAKTPAELTKASRDFADFVKLGGTEATDAFLTVAGGAAGVAKVGGAVKAAGGIGGMVSSGSAMAGKVGDVVRSAADSAVAKGDSLAEQMLRGAGQEPALATLGPSRTEMHAIPQAIRPTGSAGSPEALGSAAGQVRSETGTDKASQLLTEKNADTATGLHPDSRYEFDGGFVFHTDKLGRVSKVEATLQPDVQSGGRSQTLQKNAGGLYRLTTDEGGHLIAVRFNGPAHEANHIAQDVKLNRGAFKKLENTWANELNAGNVVKIKIDLAYPGDSQRPASLRINYIRNRIDQETRQFAKASRK